MKQIILTIIIIPQALFSLVLGGFCYLYRFNRKDMYRGFRWLDGVTDYTRWLDK